MIKRLSILLVFLLSSGAKADDSKVKQFYGWATSNDTGDPEWWYDSYESRSLCVERMEWALRTNVNYTEPFGCGYLGNNFYKVTARFVIDSFLNPIGFGCVFENLDPSSRQGKRKYGPALTGDCRKLDDLDTFETYFNNQ